MGEGEESGADRPGGLTAGSEWASLRSIALFFLRLGVTAFGGPAAHIAMMEEEVVIRRRWISREGFLDLLGAANLIPGPSSTELAIYIGYRLAGWRGLLLAGACFILPASLMVLGIAWAYVRYGSLPQLAGVLYGVKPVIIAVILQAVWRLSRAALKTRMLATVGVLSLAAALYGVNPLPILFAAGILTGVLGWTGMERGRTWKPLLWMLSSAVILFLAPLALTIHSASTNIPSLERVFLFFLKIGSVVYGSGYVLLAFLRDDLVSHWRWLSSAQLLDAIAVGQVTPGPVFTTATFIGYVIRGWAGAVVATIGIFLPGFALVGVTGRYLSRVRKSAAAGAFLDGVTIASLALMVAVSWQLGRAAIVDALTAGLAISSAVLLLRSRVNSAWLVLVAGMAGLVFYPFLHGR